MSIKVQVRGKARKLGQKAKKNWLVFLATLVFTVTSAIQVFSRSLGSVPDEAYHLEAIKQYSGQWSPILTSQSNFATTGDLTRSPSYLYHYLMSFPYRVLESLGLSDSAIQNAIGLITVGFGILSIWLLYKLLREVTTNRLAQQATALYAVIPITGIVFAGPNYDNMLLPLGFLIMLLCLKNRKDFRLDRAVLTLALIIFGCLIKFAFAPLAIILGLHLLWSVRLNWKEVSDHQLPAKFLPAIYFVFCSLLLATSIGLAWERYGQNVVRYGNPQPSCIKVQPESKCLLYSVNQRNAEFAKKNLGQPRKSVTTYVAKDWFKHMISGLVYPSSFKKFRLVVVAYVVIAGLSILVIRKTGFNNLSNAVLMLSLVVFYGASVFLDNYSTYIRTGEPFSINGRYLLPILPIILVTAQANIISWLPNNLRKYLSVIGVTGLLCASLYTVI